jgi:hypothetical protein
MEIMWRRTPVAERQHARIRGTQRGAVPQVRVGRGGCFGLLPAALDGMVIAVSPVPVIDR